MNPTFLKGLKGNKAFHFAVLIIILSIFTAFCNYYRLPLSGASDFIKYGIHFLILTSAIIGILGILACHRWIFPIFAPPVLFLCLASSISLYLFNITITSEIIEVVLKTDWSVSREFISIQLILLFLLTLIIIFYIIWLRFKIRTESSKSTISILIISILILTPALVLNKKRNNTILSRVPFSLISAANEYSQAIEVSKIKRQNIAADAVYTGGDSVLVVLILGESLRNDHLAFNGYKKNTTPLLSQREIFSFPQNKSQYTHTAASIPQILTRADSIFPDKAFSEESILSIYSRLGFKTLWFANQVPDYTYASLAKNCDKYLSLNTKTSTYSDIVSTDQNILEQLNKDIHYNDVKKKLFVLHTMGSHWYYNYRCPKEMRQFLPVTTSRSFANNSKEQMVNSYDNSVYFTDYFINEVITKFEDEKAIIIYISDHGESLGEDDKWLHAFEHETLHNAACFIWMSQKYKTDYSSIESLRKNTFKKTNTSAIFHTLLQAGSIHSEALDYTKSLLSENYSR